MIVSKRKKNFEKREVWVWIPGFEGRYKIFISDDREKVGKVKSVQRTRRGKGGCISPLRSRILKPNIGKTRGHGYYYVGLCKPGPKLGQYKMYFMRIHRIVAEICWGSCPEEMECRHKNDIPTDNRPNNLIWGTDKQNSQDAKKNGKLKPRKGENHHTAITTRKEVHKIRNLFQKGKSIKELSKQFELNYGHIWKIVKQKTWKHVI